MDALFGALLRAVGTVLSTLYDFVGNYGLAIILLTIVIRTALLPLTIKQTRSMAEMQAIQPLIKEIQKKHKGNRQKLNEELMKVYKEHKVNPLGGCLPLLMQFPFFIALYAVLNAATPAVAVPEDFQADRLSDSAVCVPFVDEDGDGVNDLPRLETPGSNQILCTNGTEETYDVEEWRTLKSGDEIDPPPTMFRCTKEENDQGDRFRCSTPRGAGHLPRDSDLYRDIIVGDPSFLGMELSCSPTQSASDDGFKQCSKGNREAGGAPLIGYWGLVVLMVGTTWYQQRQMQQMSGQVNPQMQMMGRIMPVFLGFISLTIPSGVLLYWVTTNFWQVGQQRVMMKRRAASPPSADGQRAKGVKPDPAPTKGGGKGPAVTPPTKPRSSGANRGGRSGGGSRKKRRKR